METFGLGALNPISYKFMVRGLKGLGLGLEGLGVQAEILSAVKHPGRGCRHSALSDAAVAQQGRTQLYM